MPGYKMKRGCVSETGSVVEIDIQDALAPSQRTFEEEIASLNVKEVEAHCERRKESEEFALTAAEFADTFRSSFRTEGVFRIDNWVVLHGSEYETDVAVALHEWACTSPIITNCLHRHRVRQERVVRLGRCC